MQWDISFPLIIILMVTFYYLFDSQRLLQIFFSCLFGIFWHNENKIIVRGFLGVFFLQLTLKIIATSGTQFYSVK